MTPPLDEGAYEVVLARHVLWALPDPGLALDRWLRLLTPGGRLVLIDGRWSTGAGLPAEEALELLSARECETTPTSLDDPRLWGAPVVDERYLIVAHATKRGGC